MPLNECGMTHPSQKLKRLSNLRLLIWTLTAFIFLIGCASSSKKNRPEPYQNLVTVQKPGNEPNRTARVYIDSVKKITTNNQPALLVNGTFPDACTKLKKVSHQVKNDSLFLEIEAWRNPDSMCAQVLTPFSYIYYKIPENELTSHDQIVINETAFSY